MLELFHAAIQPINLPFTLLVVLMVLYWLMVASGLVHLDSMDSGMDVHLDGHADLHADGDVHADGDAHADGDSDSHTHGHGGILNAFLTFLHVGELPVTIILSILVLCGWAFSILANHYLNPNYGLVRGLVLLVPNLIVCVLLTRVLTYPFRKIFRKLDQDFDEKIQIVGQVVKVLTGEVTTGFGQASLEHKGVPLTIQVRTTGDAVLKRGDKALVIEQDREKGLFKVVRYEEPIIEE
ncbi:MAG: hypothetical protein AB1705_02960 [Verrucomicrobiota bacterium]